MEGCSVLLLASSSCLLSDHWECFSYELWKDGNITIMLFSVTVFSFFDLYRLYSVVYFIFVFLSLIVKPSPQLKDILYRLTVLPRSCLKLVFGVSQVLKALITERSPTANILTTTAASRLETQVRVLTWHLFEFVFSRVPVLVHKPVFVFLKPQCSPEAQTSVCQIPNRPTLNSSRIQCSIKGSITCCLSCVFKSELIALAFWPEFNILLCLVPSSGSITWHSAELSSEDASAAGSFSIFWYNKIKPLHEISVFFPELSAVGYFFSWCFIPQWTAGCCGPETVSVTSQWVAQLQLPKPNSSCPSGSSKRLLIVEIINVMDWQWTHGQMRHRRVVQNSTNAELCLRKHYTFGSVVETLPSLLSVDQLMTSVNLHVQYKPTQTLRDLMIRITTGEGSVYYIYILYVHN